MDNERHAGDRRTLSGSGNNTNNGDMRPTGSDRTQPVGSYRSRPSSSAEHAARRPSGFGSVGRAPARAESASQTTPPSSRRYGSFPSAEPSAKAASTRQPHQFGASAQAGTAARRTPGEASENARRKRFAFLRRDSARAPKEERAGRRRGLHALLIALICAALLILILTLIFGSSGTYHQLPTVTRESAATTAPEIAESEAAVLPDATVVPEAAAESEAAVLPESTVPPETAVESDVTAVPEAAFQPDAGAT